MNEDVPPNDDLRATDVADGAGSTVDPSEFLTAVVAGDKAKVIRMLDQGVSPRSENDLALCVASEEGHDDLAGLLLDRGCDPEAQNFYPLRLALMRGHGAIADRLVAAARARTPGSAVYLAMENRDPRPDHPAQTPRESQVYRPEVGEQPVTIAMATRTWPVAAKTSLVQNLRFSVQPLTSRLINFALRLASDLTGKPIAPRNATKLNIKSVEMPEALLNIQAQSRTARVYPVEQTGVQVGSALSRDVPGNAPTEGTDFVEVARASAQGRSLHSSTEAAQGRSMHTIATSLLTIKLPEGPPPSAGKIDPDTLMDQVRGKMETPRQAQDSSLDIPSVPRAASTVTPRRPRPE